MLKYFFVIFLTIYSYCYAWEVGIGLFKDNQNFQNQSGNKEQAPYRWAFSFGHTFNLTPQYVFSPSLMYSKRSQISDDDYGSDYDITTIALLYDFLWSPSMSVHDGYTIRYGIGNFMKKIKGKGGSIVVPNGSSGSSTAYRPGSESTSYTMSINLGAEYFFSPFIESLNSCGLRFETFWMHPLDSEKRVMNYNLMLIGYF